jgi:formate hydrogenlyase subunit 3/multisubunit Na+/H+ antiporter MnhD subunit
MQLFAFQDVPSPEAGFPTWIIVIAGIAVALMFVGFLFWLIIRQVAKSRELSHLERMKALELGQAIGPSEAEKCQSKYLHNVFWICFWLGAGVPIAATSAASSVMIQTNLHEYSVIVAIWICVAVISVASVVCAAILMISSRHWSSKRDKDSLGNERPV